GPNKMVIYSGPNRTVHYFATPGSLGEASTLRELERAENEMEYVDSLQALRRQYVNNERYLDAGRAVIQDRLYGTAIESGGSSFFTGSAPYAGGYGGYVGPFFGGGYFGESYGLSSSTRVARSLAIGVGDEGRLK